MPFCLYACASSVSDFFVRHAPEGKEVTEETFLLVTTPLLVRGGCGAAGPRERMIRYVSQYFHQNIRGLGQNGPGPSRRQAPLRGGRFRAAKKRTGPLQSQVRNQAVCRSCGFANPTEFRFCGNCGSALQGPPSRRVVAAPAGEAERRQLTVLFCDLVDSSRLSTQLDPEDLRDLILSYQRTCTAAIQRFGGTVSRYIGDGIMALFGYPLAHEDAAERAVHAGLDIVEAIAALSSLGDTRFHGRARGCRDRSRRRRRYRRGGRRRGAGRGWRNAEPRRAAAGACLAELRCHCLAHARAPRRALRVRGSGDARSEGFRGTRESVAGSAHDARGAIASRAVQPLPLINREAASRWLLGLWSEVEQSRGKVALLSGEAGIGKSRIVRGLRETLSKIPHTALRYQCSPHYVNTALHPVIDHIERAAAIGREDTAAVKLERLASWLGGGSHAREALPFLAALLSIPTADERFVIGAMSPQRQKEHTFELLFGLIDRLAAARAAARDRGRRALDGSDDARVAHPVHRTRAQDARVARGHVQARISRRNGWASRMSSIASSNASSRSTPSSSREAVASRTASAAQVEQVVARTDGVPLFIEELTKAVVEAHGPGGDRREREARSADRLTEIPATLQDSLMARLDQLGPAKSSSRRSPARSAVSSATSCSKRRAGVTKRLREGLRVLEQSGLVYADRRARKAKLRVQACARAGGGLSQSVAQPPARAASAHCRSAGERSFRKPRAKLPSSSRIIGPRPATPERAVDAWLAAGRRASERSEYREAIGHLRRGLALIPRLAERADAARA